MARLQLCDYHNMVAILETTEHNANFHPMVDFIEASPLRRNLKLQDEKGISSLPDTELFENLTLMGYNISPNQKFTFQKGQFSHQWKQYTRRTRIAQSSVLPTVADEPASPLRDVNQGEACPTDSGFIADQDRETIDKSSTLPYDSAPRVTSPVADEGTQEVEINRLKKRVKMFEDREGVVATRSGDDAPIKGRSMDEGEAATERISDDSEEMATVLTSMDAATVLASGVVDVFTGSRSIPTASTPAKEQVPTGSDVVPTVARELEEQLEREDQRRSEQITRDAEIARINAKEELQIMIDGLDKNNETIAKYLQEYHQFASELPIEKRIELITDLVKGMTFKEVEAKFNSVWKQMEDFIPMGSKEEAERIKRKGLNLEQESVKKQKTSEEVPEEVMSHEEVLEEKVKEMMLLFPIEEVYVEALQIKHPIIDWKSASCNIQGQRNLHASREGLPSNEGSSTCDDQLQASSGELLKDGK
nr:hypothetical protein [Tanacetum cinerariifolium]